MSQAYGFQNIFHVIIVNFVPLKKKILVKDQIKTLHNNDNSNSINSNNKIKSTTFTYHPYIQDKNQ